MRLSIVFPAFNEELNIRLAVGEALDYLQKIDGEVIVINDGSSDETGKIVDDLAKKHPQLHVLHHPQNQGYAPTLRDGFLAAKGDWIFYSDSDLQFVLREIDQLFEKTEGADMVVGYRKNRQDPPTRIFAAGCYNALVRSLFGLRGVRDIDCAFKLFRRDVFQKIKIESKDFLVDAEILLKANKLGMVIREIPVTHQPRKFGQSTVRLKHVINTLLGLGKLYFKLNESKS